MRSLFLFAALPLLLLAHCGGGGSTGGSGGVSSPKIRVHVTDAPFPGDFVESATIVVEEVRARRQTEGEEEAWVTLFTGEAEIDLVPLVGGVEALLVEADVEPGTYDEIRLIVSAGEVVLTEEAFTATGDRTFTVEDGTLVVPSGASSGIKIKLEDPIVVTTSLSGDLLLDFDLSRSFVFNGPVDHAPGVRRVLFKPVVRAVNVSTAGSITVEVHSDSGTPDVAEDDALLENATVRVLDAEGNEVAVTLTDAFGRATVSVPPGTYDVEISAAGHATQTISGAEVFLANLTDLGVVVLEQFAGEISGIVMSDAATAGDPTDDVVVEGVTVELRAAGDATLLATATTDAQGAFRFESLEPGAAFDLSFSASGFADATLPAVLADAAGGQADVLLVAFTRTLTGVVSDAVGDPIPGVSVTATNEAGVVVGPTTTDAAGSYALVLATGTYAVVFDDGAGTTLEETVVVVGTDPVSDQTLDVTLAP